MKAYIIEMSSLSLCIHHHNITIYTHTQLTIEINFNLILLILINKEKKERETKYIKKRVVTVTAILCFLLLRIKKKIIKPKSRKHD